MKRKRCFKSILSGILAAVMILTAAPVNSLTVSAAQVETEITDVNEVTPVSELDGEPEQTAQPETEIQAPETNDGAAEGEGDGGAGGDTGTGGDTGEGTEPPVTGDNFDAAVTHSVAGNTVTFTCVPTDSYFAYWDNTANANVNLAASDIDRIIVKGGLSGGSWSEMCALTKGENNTWTGQATLIAGKYEYKFFAYRVANANGEHYAVGGNKGFTINGILGTNVTALKNQELSLDAQLSGYKEDNEATIPVSYALSQESSAYSEHIEITGDVGSQKLLVKNTLDASVKAVTLTATDTSDENNTATVKVTILAKEYTEDGNVKSPVPGKGEATFNHFAPAAETVTVKGSFNGWTNVPMVFNEDTGYWSVTLKMDKGTYEYGFEVNGAWTKDKLNTDPKAENGNDLVTVTEDDVDKPVSPYPAVTGTTVKFTYVNNALPDDAKVCVAGIDGWDEYKDGYMLKKNAETGEWELTLTGLAAGRYTYKFVYFDANETDPAKQDKWVTDDRNTNPLVDGNSVFYIAGLKMPGEAPIVKLGNSAKLPAGWTLYAANGITSDAAVTYALSEETAKAEYAGKITLAAVEGVPTVSISEDFPADVTSFTLTAKGQDAEGKEITADFSVNVVEAIYKYTIYYYDEIHTTIKDAALWIWETDGAPAKAPTYFTETEVLADGNTWMKATAEVSYANMSIIPRSYSDDWAWQDSDRVYKNTDGEDKTLYIVYQDGAGRTNIYTELPEIVPLEKRYIVAEYTRTTQTASDWYFYTWNNGYTGFYPFEGEGNKKMAVIPLGQGLDTITFCLERTYEATDTLPEGAAVGDHWGEKDGGDHFITMPVDQSVIKIKIEEGKGVVGAYPYNIGYEIAPKESKIHFYYRNDEKFKAGSEGGYASVQIEINGKAYNMVWNAEDQRYTYDLENLVPGTYQYRYILKETASSDPEYVLDKFNEVTTEDQKYSVCEYQTFEANVTAEVFNANMDYNDNNVLSVAFEGKNGADVSGMEASSIMADLTALGGGLTPVDPKLMELSIAVKEGVAAGEKNIPITVIDQYANEYKTETKVNVVDRQKGADFDWDEAIIYFAVTDRFFDGNPSNNNPGYDTSATGPSSYHGGDFAGLTQKLDYLKDLGVNTVWITPIVANDMKAGLQTDVAGITSWGYHGYWASNFEKIDSHLGTEEEFKELLDAAHARGMKIMVDGVLNHSGYGQEGYFNGLLKDEAGNPIRMIREGSEMVDGNDQMSSLSGLPDFLTEKDEVRELLVEWQSNWISKYDIDYYRVDTVKHVDDTTWSAFKNALTKIDPDFKMIGEWAGAGYGTNNGMLRGGRMDSLLDFDYNGRALDFATGKISDTEKFLNARNAAIDNTATLGAFIGSHDEDGYIYTLVNERKVSKEKATELARVAASLQITSKGQVVIYYGEELGMTGANNYPYQENRYDFDWSQANESNATFAHYKKMLAIRNKYSEVLAKGSRKTIEASDEKGLDVFQRSWGDTTLTVGLNITDKETEYTIAGLKAGAMYTDCYSGTRYVSDENGNVTVLIPAAAQGGTVVLAEGEFEERFIINQIPDQTYTGKNITFTPAQLKVYYGLTELKPGTDYTVKYKNNKTVGTATVTVTGKGNYTGQDVAEFNILPKDVAGTDIVYQDAMIETGKNLKPLTKITHNGIKLGTKDYKAEYYLLDENGNRTGEALSTVKTAGDYDLVITGLYDAETGRGNFTGSVTKRIRIYAKDSVTYIKNTVITFPENKRSYSQEYTGAAIEPLMMVVPKGSNKEPLTLGKEYTVSYNNQVEVGTAQVTITGVPEEGYIGSVTKTYKITGVKLSSVAQVDEANWQQKVVYDVVSGKAVQPGEITLKAKPGKEDTFTQGKDYTVSYQKNDKPGSATMVFTGKGKYTGTVTKKFTVTKIDLKADDSRLKYQVAPEAAYEKKGAKAAVSVSYDGVTLREGADYKLTFVNNKALTTEETPANKIPYVKIIGTGNFAGTIFNMDAADTKHTTFSVVKSDLGTLKLTAVDKVFKDKNGAFISAPVLTENTGAKLVNNKDYEVKYYVTNEAGVEEEKTKTDTVAIGETGYTTVKMIATAKDNSNYKGTIETTYRVVQASISGAKVTVQAKVYTGKAITIDAQDFTKIKIGTTDLVYGQDYEIVKDSYVNNVKKGTASVTIKGLGNYGGTKKVTFKITSRTVAWWWNLLN